MFVTGVTSPTKQVFVCRYARYERGRERVWEEVGYILPYLNIHGMLRILVAKR